MNCLLVIDGITKITLFLCKAQAPEFIVVRPFTHVGIHVDVPISGAGIYLCASAACLSCDGIGVVTTISRDGELGNRKVEEVRISPDRS